MRQARRGTLQTRERFFIRSTFDPPGGVLTLTSVPARRLSEEDNQGQSMSDLSVALRRGAVTSIVWDHSALGSQVVLELRRSQWVTVFVGVGEGVLVGCVVVVMPGSWANHHSQS